MPTAPAAMRRCRQISRGWPFCTRSSAPSDHSKDGFGGSSFMTKTICMLFLIRFGMVCYLPPLCAEEKVQVPGTVEDATGAAEVIDEITVSARANDPLSPEQNATAVHLEGEMLRSLPAKAEDPLAGA